MTELLYVITAETFSREQDGQHPQDGSSLQRVITSRETWTFPASTPIGEIMKEVHQTSDYVTSVTITEDRVSAQKVREERMAASRARNPELEV